MRLTLRLWMTLWGALWAIALVACVTISETGQQRFIIISPTEEAQLGSSAFKELKEQKPRSSDGEKNAQVDRVVAKLLPHTNTDAAQWEAVLFEDPTPNAFALPGGKIGIHTGILPYTKTDAGLAAVVGHELAHVTLRHGAQRMSAQMATMLGYAGLGIALHNEDYRTRQLAMTAYGLGSAVFLILPYSREHELEADRIGLRYMAKAGYDPREAVAFWQRMSQAGGSKPPEILSTHPADSRRIAEIEAMLPAVMPYYEAARLAQQTDSQNNLAFQPF